MSKACRQHPPGMGMMSLSVSGSLGWDRLWCEGSCGPTQGRPSLPRLLSCWRPAASRRNVEVGLLCPLTGFGSLNKFSVGT